MVSDIVVHGFKIQMISTEENVFKTDSLLQEIKLTLLTNRKLWINENVNATFKCVTLFL